MKVTAFKGNTSIFLKDVIGFGWKLQKYSELDNIINKIRSHPVNIQSEVTKMAEMLKEISNDRDDIDETI